MNTVLVFTTLETVLSVALIVVIGFAGVKAGILGEGTLKELSTYLVYICIPCTIIAKLYVMDSITQAVYGVAITTAAQIISIFIGYFLGCIFNVSKEHKGVNGASFGICNSGFIGLPIVIMLFGEAAKNIGIYFVISNNIVFWTLGAYMIKRDARVMGTLKQADNTSFIDRLKKLSPPIVTFVIMLFIKAVKLPLPGFFMSAVEIVDETTAPAALIFCGTVLGTIGFKRIRWRKGFSLIMLGRYIISPLIMAGLLFLFPTDSLFEKVLIVQAAMPVVTLVEVGAKKYGGDVEYASLAFIYSLFILAITLPITYYVLMSV